MPAGEITPEQHRLWEGFVRSNPSRVVHALVLGFRDQPNPWGDTLADFHPALAAVDQAAIQRDQRWQRLADVGVADVLCINVLSTKMKNYLQALPSGSKDVQNIPSSFFKPMDILLHAALNFSFPPNGTDMKVITALKKYWSMMVFRLIKEPENSLKPGEPYIYERGTPAHLFSRILLADPSFTCVLDNERDYTIQLVSRSWTYATGPGDTLLNTSLLSDFIDGATNAIRAYKNSHPFTPSLFIRIIQGANNVGNIISAMASHLNFYRGFDGLMEVSLLDSIWKMAVQETHPLHSKLLSAHRESRPLWTSIFSLQRRTANDDRPLIDGYTDGHISVIIPLVHHTANTISHCISEASLKECVDLIACWVAADLFGTLDVIIPFFAHGPRSFSSQFVRNLTLIFYDIESTLQRAQTLVPLLRPQFPRARSFRALVDLSHTTDSQASPTPDADSNLPECWMLFRNIQRACVLKDDCTRRDCDRKRTAQCVACKKAGYCSIDCQKRDWPEHKRACKLEIKG